MSVRLSGVTFSVPSNIARSYHELSAVNQQRVLDELCETVLDLKAIEEAEEYNRTHPKQYTLDEIRKELDLS